MEEQRGHLLRWERWEEDGEDEWDYEIIHPYACPVRWDFQRTAAVIGKNGWELQSLPPEWYYDCGVSYETTAVGIASLEQGWPFYGQGYPPESGLYELIWWNRGSGEDFESGFRWENL